MDGRAEPFDRPLRQRPRLGLGSQGVAENWSVVPSPNPNASLGDNGLAGVVAVPGGGIWAVGETTNTQGNYATLILHHR